jgi:hypothetical protein
MPGMIWNKRNRKSKTNRLTKPYQVLKIGRSLEIFLEKVIGSMQTEEAENSGDSIPLSTRGAFRFSATIEKLIVFDHTRAELSLPGHLIQEDPAR